MVVAAEILVITFYGIQTKPVILGSSPQALLSCMF